MLNKFKKYSRAQYFIALLYMIPVVVIGVMGFEYYLAHRPLTGSQIASMQADTVDKEFSIDLQIKSLKVIRKKFKPWVLQHQWMMDDLQSVKNLSPIVTQIWNDVPFVASYPVHEPFDRTVDYIYQHQEMHIIPARLYGFLYTWVGDYKAPIYRVVNGQLEKIPDQSLYKNRFSQFFKIAQYNHDIIVAQIFCPGKYHAQLWLSGKITETVENEVPVRVIYKHKEVIGSRLQTSQYHQVFKNYSFTN